MNWFREKPSLEFNVTMGCLVISKSCIPALREATEEGKDRDIMTHFVPNVINKGMNVVPFYLNGFWYDVGTTEAYEKMGSKQIEDNLRFLDEIQ